LIYNEDRSLPAVLIADKGYDADYIRQRIEEAGGSAIIPGRSLRINPVQIDSFIYALRNAVERCFSWLKQSRRVATRYDKTALAFLSFVQIAAVRIWIKRLST